MEIEVTISNDDKLIDKKIKNCQEEFDNINNILVELGYSKIEVNIDMLIKEKKIKPKTDGFDLKNKTTI